MYEDRDPNFDIDLSVTNSKNVTQIGFVRRLIINLPGWLKKLFFFVLFGIVAFLALIALGIWRPEPLPPSLAYEFLVDTSVVMAEPFNNTTRFEIVTEAIERTIRVPGLGARQVWQGLRLAGGGDQCDQTSLVSQGLDQTVDGFMAPLRGRTPEGVNAYELGFLETANDFGLNEPAQSDIKVAFIFLGSLESYPCREVSLPATLAAYNQLGISTTLCTFTLLKDVPGFERFRQEMLDRGLDCVHNVDDPEEISSITLGIIQQLIRQEEGEEEILTPIFSPTPVVYVAPTIFTSTPGSTSTPEPSNTPTETPTYTLTPDLRSTELAQTAAFSTELAFAIAQTDAALTATAEVWTDTPTWTPRATFTPSSTPTDTLPPTLTPNYRLTDAAETQSVLAGNTAVVLAQTQAAAAWTDTPAPSSTSTPSNTATSITTRTPTNITVTVINETGANLRDGPGTNYNVVGSAQQDESFLVEAQTADGQWYLITRSDGREAWVASWIVDLSPSGAQVEVAATIPASPTALTPSSSTVIPPPIELTCNPGSWDTCGSHDCPSDHTAQCNNAGTGWDCNWDPGTCSSSPGGGGGSNTSDGLYINVSPPSYLSGGRVRIEVTAGSVIGTYVQSIEWNWGDGSVESGWLTGTHQYSSTGTYNITITATDNMRNNVSQGVTVNID